MTRILIGGAERLEISRAPPALSFHLDGRCRRPGRAIGLPAGLSKSGGRWTVDSRRKRHRSFTVHRPPTTNSYRPARPGLPLPRRLPESAPAHALVLPLGVGGRRKGERGKGRKGERENARSSSFSLSPFPPFPLSPLLLRPGTISSSATTTPTSAFRGCWPWTLLTGTTWGPSGRRAWATAAAGPVIFSVARPRRSWRRN